MTRRTSASLPPIRGGGAVADRSVAFRQCGRQARTRKSSPGHLLQARKAPPAAAGSLRVLPPANAFLSGDSYPHVRHYHRLQHRTAPRPQGASHHDDRRRRLHRHGTFRGVRRDDRPGRSRQRPARLLDHRPHGLLPDDEPRRTRRLRTRGRLVLHLRPPLRRRRLRLRPRLELLLQLGHYGRSRPCGRPARHGLVVPRRARNTLERTFPRVHIHAQLHIRKRLRRDGILVRAPQGRNRDPLHLHGLRDDLRNPLGRHACGLRELGDRRP